MVCLVILSKLIVLFQDRDPSLSDRSDGSECLILIGPLGVRTRLILSLGGFTPVETALVLLDRSLSIG